jgi:hypothetical protein
MMKAAAVERLTPAQQWTSIGRAASQPAREVQQPGDQAASGAVKPSRSSAMS